MKKLMLTIVAAALVFLGTANAQTQTTTKTKAKGDMKDKPMQSNALRDGIMMHGGKLIVMKEGKASTMTEDMTMANGSMVMKDGSVKMKDGSTTMLKNGDHMDMQGNIVHSMGEHDKMEMNGKGKMKSNSEKVKYDNGKTDEKIKHDKADKMK
jgi:Ni/Co efflux regulator RcnB